MQYTAVSSQLLNSADQTRLSLISLSASNWLLVPTFNVGKNDFLYYLNEKLAARLRGDKLLVGDCWMEDNRH